MLAAGLSVSEDGGPSTQSDWGCVGKTQAMRLWKGLLTLPFSPLPPSWPVLVCLVPPPLCAWGRGAAAAKPLRRRLCCCWACWR